MITKELRKYVWDKVPSKHLEDLIGIADAIDKAHDEKLIQAKAVVLLDCVSAANDFIELPKDADGVTIHIGDELEWPDGNRLTVNGIGEGGTLFYVDAQGDVQWTASGDKRHVKPDSWEAIIEDAASYGDKRWFSGTQGDKAIIAELVERCKRLAGEDA